MGVVFSAHHRDAPARTVALKLLRRERAASPDSVERFRREMRALAALSHPNVVRILGGTLEGPEPHYVMELVAGESLEAVLARGPLEPRRACELVRDVVSAIEAAHAAGIVHRDLKPSNILVDGNGCPRICDFGLATADQTERLTRTGVFLGTAAWAAPEQLVGDAHRADERTDVFALGALLWASLAGRGPFDDVLASGRGRVLGTSCPTPSTITQGVPSVLDAVCARALEEEPEARYQTARELREDIERWLRGEKTSVESRSRGRAWIVALAVVAATSSLAAFWPKRAIHESGKPNALDALVAAAARKPGEAPKVAALEAAAALAVDAPDRVVLVGEGVGFALGHELLDARDVLRVTRNDAGASFEAVALLAAANALAGARLARSPADPAGHALRAYAALAAAGAPRAPLEPGELDGIAESALSDLEAASALPGPPGSRAAWLLVDLRAARGDEDAARAALERARARFPDDASRGPLERVLATAATPEGLASLLREAREAKTLASAVVLSRFLARLGAPAACEHPEVAFDARALERVLAPEVPRASSSEYVSLRSRELKEARNTYWNARHGARGEASGATWTTLAPLLRRSVTLGPTDPEVLGDCADPERASLASAPFLVLASARVLGWTCSLSDTFCPGVRIGNRAVGESSFSLSPRWETGAGIAGCDEFDRRLAADVESDEIVQVALAHGLDRRELDRAVSAARGLRRLEALENDAPDGELERTRLALEAFRGLEDMARLGGGAGALFRARVRRLVLPPPLGAALARLELARLARDIRATCRDPRSLVFGEGLSGLALQGSGVAAEVGADGEERALFDLGCHILRECGIEAGPEELVRVLGEGTSHFSLNPLYRAVKWKAPGREHAFEATPEDLARARKKPFVYRAP